MKIKSGVWYCMEDNVIQVAELIKMEGVKDFYEIETEPNTYYYMDHEKHFVDSMIYLGEL